jgi:hypothetical protein
MARGFFIGTLIAGALSFFALSATADEAADTLRTDTTAAPVVSSGDSLSDTLFLDTAYLDTAYLPDSLLSDTLTPAQKAQLRFEKRLQKRQEQLAEELPPAPFSYLDSLFRYFSSPRLDLRQALERANQHDAGDYFRPNPAYFVVDWQESPMRKTVQPYSLTGDRLGVVQSGQARHPFEHVPEPDGLMDMNDIPTAMDGEIYLMPGPSGLLFGSDRAIASLITRPQSYPDNEAHSSFLVDKGTYGYSNARARFSRSFSDGRRIDFSLGYRNADGPGFFGGDDDAYHYTADFKLPLKERLTASVSGLLYDREGSLRVDGVRFDRDRFDRSLQAGLEWVSPERTAVTSAYYRHERGSADLSRSYFAKLNSTVNGATLRRDWLAGDLMIRASAHADNHEFDYGSGSETRAVFGGELSIATRSTGFRYAVRVGSDWSKAFDAAPFGSATAFYDSDHWLVMLSAGYLERAPSLLEQYLPYRTGAVYSITLPPYADRGNSSLKSEKQATGSFTIEAGWSAARCRVEVTGGRIYDGIDWLNSFETINGSVVRLFEPQNGDIDFVTTTVQPQVRIADFLRLLAGASYHYTAYETTLRPAYAPEYLAFAGGEIHIFWPQRLLDFYAYGELVYTGPYDGLDGEPLGQGPVANTLLAVQMGRFRFHFAFNNVFSRVYEQREDNFFVGRYTSYGFVWNFLN